MAFSIRGTMTAGETAAMTVPRMAASRRLIPSRGEGLQNGELGQGQVMPGAQEAHLMKEVAGDAVQCDHQAGIASA